MPAAAGPARFEGTVEGRAILGYYRVRARPPMFAASAERAMKWAKEFRMDEPWSQLRREHPQFVVRSRGRTSGKPAEWP